MAEFLFGILIGIIVVLALIYSNVRKTQRIIIRLESLYSKRFELYAEEVRGARCDAGYIRLALDKIILPGCNEIKEFRNDPKVAEKLDRLMSLHRKNYEQENN